MNKILIVVLTLSATAFAESPSIVIDKKSHDKAFEDFKKSKIDASKNFKKYLKQYDLNRLPKKYQKMFYKHVYGQAPMGKQIEKIQKQYENIMNNTARIAADSDKKITEQYKKLFEDPFSLGGSNKVSTKVNIPFQEKKSLKQASGFSISKPKPKTISTLVSVKEKSSQALDKSTLKDLALFVKNNKKQIKRTNSIFDKHTKTYLTDIYKKLKK